MEIAFTILRPSDAADMARLHASGFASPWSAETFADLLGEPGSLALGVVQGELLIGFALVRLVLGEADLLTIVMDPKWQGKGIAARLLTALIHRLGERGADRVILDVAEDNTPALRLYETADFKADGRRRGYYTSGRDKPVDAILMSLNLGFGR